MQDSTCVTCQASMPTNSAMMTVDGMKCSNCIEIVAPMNEELLQPAGAMPGKLVLLLGFMALGFVLNLVTMSLFSAALGAALIAGIFVGNDGVRRFVLALAWIQLVVQVVGLLVAFSAQSSLVVIALIGVAYSTFVIWTLMQDDVRTWMFKTAFKDGLDDV